MSTSIASAVASSIKHKPDDAWLRRGQDIARRMSRQQWEIGDWLVEGHEKWDRKAYDAAERIFANYNRATLRNLAYVARAVETSRRSDVLSWSHHEAVAAMKPAEQKELLAYAADKHLSFAAFRRHLNALQWRQENEEIDREIERDEKERQRKLESESEEEKQARLERERQFNQREEQFRQRLAEQKRVADRRPELAKEVIHAGRRALAKRHPDLGGSNDAMVELNLERLCVKHGKSISRSKDGVRQCDVCEKPSDSPVCDECTQKVVCTLGRLAKHFNVPVPEFHWCSLANSHGRTNGNRIELSTTSYVPVKDNLAHEFAHYLTDRDESEHFLAAARERKPSQLWQLWSSTGYWKGRWKPHGRQFFCSLSAVVAFLYENPDEYSWDEEKDQIIRWRESAQRRDE